MKAIHFKLATAALVVSAFLTAHAKAQTVVFAEDFNGYYGNQNALQIDTGLPVSFGGWVPGWTATGGNAAHAVNFGGNNYAISFINDNVLTLNGGVAANLAGERYTVAFDAGASTYSFGGIATDATDGLVISVLRDNSTLLSSTSVLPGAWNNSPNAQALSHYSFDYVGDGSGDVRFSISTINPTAARFGGAIDNLTVTTPVPEPTTWMMMGLGLLALGTVRRMRRGRIEQ